MAAKLDLYGPFPSANEIAFVPDEAARPTRLTLGDFALQVSGCEPVCLEDNERFILSALLREPDGALMNEDLLDAGFGVKLSVSNRNPALSRSTKSLIESAGGGKRHVITKDTEEHMVVIRLKPTLHVDRQPGELDLSDYPEVAAHAARMVTKHGLNEILDPLTQLGIPQEVAAGIRGYIFGDGPAPDISSTYEHLFVARKALKLLSEGVVRYTPEEAKFQKISKQLADQWAKVRMGQPAAKSRYFRPTR